MDWATFQGIFAGLALFAFIHFAFIRGWKVKPGTGSAGGDSGYIPPAKVPSHH